MTKPGATATATATDYQPPSVVADAAAFIRRQWRVRPAVGLILGTGLGAAATRIEEDLLIPYRSIPGFPVSTALAHAGRLVCGHLAGVPVVAMQGRCHRYEGHSFETLALPVRVMHALGAGALIASNAAGGLNPQLRTGDVVVIEDHVNLLGGGPSVGPWELCPERGGRAQGPVYDRQLMAAALAVARRENFSARPGVYVAVSGPNYETRAEYRWFRRFGDVVGMSTVPETSCASGLGMRALALSIVTNVATPDAPLVVDAEEVVAAAAAAEPHVSAIVRSVVAEFG